MEAEIKGAKYRSGRLTPFVQAAVVRRLLPCLVGLGTAVKEMKLKVGDIEQMDDLATIVNAFGPIASAISKMSDDDFNFVLNACMDVTTRLDGEKWARIRAVGGGFMYEDIDLSVMMQITYKTLAENLGNFLPGMQKA